MDEEGHHVTFELLRRCDGGASSSAVGRAAVRRLLGSVAASACTAGGPLLLLLLLAGVPRLQIARRCADHPLGSLPGAGRGHSYGTLWKPTVPSSFHLLLWQPGADLVDEAICVYVTAIKAVVLQVIQMPTLILLLLC